MTTNQPRDYTVAPDEKVTPVMAYTTNEMMWGEVVTKEIIRVGAWLRTDMAPTYLNLHGANRFNLSSDAPAHPEQLKQLFIPVTEVIAFHVMPSVKEPLYYDPNKANRKLEPVTVMSGMFRFKGSLFLSTNASVEQFLDVTREPFIPLFHVEITHPKMPRVITVPFTVVRQITSLFSVGH